MKARDLVESNNGQAIKVQAVKEKPVEDKALKSHREKTAEVKKQAEAKLAELSEAKAKPATAKAVAEKAADLDADAAKAEKGAKGKFVQKAAVGLFQQLFAPFNPPRPLAPVQVQMDVFDIDAGDFIAVEADAFAAPAIAVNQAAPPADLNQAEQQMFAHFQSMLPQQLAFAKQACNLDRDQSKAVTDEVSANLKTLAKDYVKAANQPRKVVRINNVRRVEPGQANPKAMLEKSILSAFAQAKLPEDKAEIYTQELAKREEFRKQACIEAFVGLIDERLVLDASQREKLAVAITKNWDDNWTNYLDTLLYNNNFAPPIPNQIVLPILRKDQKDVWQSATNQNGQDFIFGGVMIGR